MYFAMYFANLVQCNKIHRTIHTDGWAFVPLMDIAAKYNTLFGCEHLISRKSQDTKF